MSSSWGIKAKLYGMIGTIIAAFAVGGYFTTADILKVREAFDIYETTQAYHSLILKSQRLILDTNLIAIDMLIDSQQEDFKGVQKSRYDALQQARIDLDASMAVLQKDAAKFNMIEPVAAMKDSALLLYRHVETLGNSIRTKRLSAEDSAKSVTTITAAKDDSLRRSRAAFERIAAELSKSSAKHDFAVGGLQRTLLSLILFAMFTLLVAGVANTRKLMTKISESQSIIGSATREQRQTSELLSDASQKIASIANNSTPMITECVQELTDLTSLQNITSRHRAEQLSFLNKIEAKCNDGSKLISTIANSMRAPTNSADKPDISGSTIDRLKSLTKAISDVSLKSQLISINASIEAARVGHHGKGFSIVANEIGNISAALAKISHQMTMELQDLNSKAPSTFNPEKNWHIEIEKISDQLLGTLSAISEISENASKKDTQIQDSITKQQAITHQLISGMSLIHHELSALNQSSRDSVHLGTLLLKQCDRMKLASDQFHLAVFGDTASAAPLFNKDPIADVPKPDMNEYEIDPGVDKVISIAPTGPSAEISDNISVNDDERLKGTGTDS